MVNFKLLIAITIVSALSLLVLSGCSDAKSQLPNGIYSAPMPLTILAVGADGVILSDAQGKIYSYNKGYYFARTIMESELKAGDILE